MGELTQKDFDNLKATLQRQVADLTKELEAERRRYTSLEDQLERLGSTDEGDEGATPKGLKGLAAAVAKNKTERERQREEVDKRRNDLREKKLTLAETHGVPYSELKDIDDVDELYLFVLSYKKEANTDGDTTIPKPPAPSGVTTRVGDDKPSGESTLHDLSKALIEAAPMAGGKVVFQTSKFD